MHTPGHLHVNAIYQLTACKSVGNILVRFGLNKHWLKHEHESCSLSML